MSRMRQGAWYVWFAPLIVWAVLCVLLAATVGSAFVPMGLFNSLVNLAIAALKAGLIAIVFMSLVRSSVLLRLAAAAGLFWLSFMFILTSADYLTRP